MTNEQQQLIKETLEQMRKLREEYFKAMDAYCVALDAMGYDKQKPPLFVRPE